MRTHLLSIGALALATACAAAPSGTNANDPNPSAVAPSGGSDAGPTPIPPDGAQPSAPATQGHIDFHLLLGVPKMDVAQDSIVLDGDRYTDLIVSNLVAGVMYGHLITTLTPKMQFNRDFLYGSIMGQLLQENLATQLYSAKSSLIDSSSDQQAVMGAGQGGPYQINNYAADMVYGSYNPDGYSLINYIALQKNIGFSFAVAPQQHGLPTPEAFNDKLLGPMITAYFHFNDYAALAAIGPNGGYTPQWEPDYDNALVRFETLPGNFLEVLLNAAYNQGYYGPLVSQYSKLGASATPTTVAQVDDWATVWGKDDTYVQYPYQVRYYLSQLYDLPIPTTSPTATMRPHNHVRVDMGLLESTFVGVMAKLAYVDGKGIYGLIPAARATSAFEAAMSRLGLRATAALDVCDATHRRLFFGVVEDAIAGLEAALPTDFTARAKKAL